MYFSEAVVASRRGTPARQPRCCTRCAMGRWASELFSGKLSHSCCFLFCSIQGEVWLDFELEALLSRSRKLRRNPTHPKFEGPWAWGVRILQSRAVTAEEREPNAIGEPLRFAVLMEPCDRSQRVEDPQCLLHPGQRSRPTSSPSTPWRVPAGL